MNINIKNEINFNDDLNSLLKLIKKDNFSERITEEFIHFHCLSGENKLIYVVWNRFTKKFDFKFLESKELISDDCEFNDFISYFTVLKVDSKIYKRKLFKELPKEKEKLISMKEEIKKILKKEVLKNLLAIQKERLKSMTSNDWSYFFNKAKIGYFYPIDVFPREMQLELFWLKSDLFNFSRLTQINDFITLKSDAVLTKRNLILDNEYNLVEPFSKVKNYLIDLASDELNKNDLDFSSKSKLMSFLLTEGLNTDNVKAREIIDNPFDFILKSVNYFLETLDRKLYKGENINLDFPYFIIPNKFNSKNASYARIKITLVISEWLKENGYKSACYYENISAYNIYKEAIGSSTLLDSFSKLSFLRSYVNDFGIESLIYSPIYGTAKFSFSEDEGDDNFEKAEDFIRKNKIKTSKIVKDYIKKLLDLPIINFSEKEKSHLNFVLFMDTVD